MYGVVSYESDCCLVRVHGYHVHRNNGWHLDGGVSDNEVWQIWWRILVSQFILWYCNPSVGVIH